MAESSAAGASLKMRSIYVGSAGVPSPTDAESESGLAHRASSGVPQPQDGSVDHFNGNNNDSARGESKDEALDPIRLPQSTHSLLFSEPVCSLPFGFGFVILSISFACLGLAFLHNFETDDIPFNVTPSVRAAQYLSILVALLMEEEIPTGLYLLRMIPRQSLRQKFPRMKYRKFIFSSIIRIFNGYLFLVNVILVLIRATGVIDIFYDVLALQFVQHLDDIAFSLAKMDVFGKKMQRACTAKCFRAEFEQRRFGRNKNMTVFLKALYFFNLCVMLAGMCYVTVKQVRGDYQHSSITVDFGNTIWESSWAKVSWWMNSTQEYEEGPLVYSFFNGVYKRNGTESHDGRPVYKETRKFDRTPYEFVVPAEIKYCKDVGAEGAWVFTHQDMRKSKSRKEAGCRNWLLRSPDTSEYDLLKVVGNWKVWVGVIGKADVSIATNLCNDETDCNLHGQCVDQECICDHEDGARYLGTHCEVRLRDSCETIVGERYNETWNATYLRSWSEDNFGSGDDLYEQYSRPVYSYVGGVPEWDESDRGVVGEGIRTVIYSGNRWFATYIVRENETSYEDLMYAAMEYHAFWSKVYSTVTYFVSDPTTRSTPVGVDFYEIGERGEQFGPLGALYPAQLHNQMGRGYFRCSDDVTASTSNRKLQFQTVLGHEPKRSM